MPPAVARGKEFAMQHPSHLPAPDPVVKLTRYLYSRSLRVCGLHSLVNARHGNSYLPQKQRRSREEKMKKTIFVYLAAALSLGAIFAIYQARMTAASTDENVIFTNVNAAPVQSNPSSATKFSLKSSSVIKTITDYHFNNGRGAEPGTITLRDATGRTAGPWQATGTPGADGVANENWTVSVNMHLPKGDYTIIDSEPSTWSRNSQSGNQGFSTVTGNSTEQPAPKQ